MPVSSDLKTIDHMLGKGAYTGVSKIDAYTAYILMALLVANDEVAAAKSRAKSHLYTEDYLHSPLFQYCVEAVQFFIPYSFASIKDTTMFYTSAVLFMHQAKNTIGHWRRLVPSEINAPSVRRYVAKTLAREDNYTLLSRTNLPGLWLSYCISSMLDTHPDTYSSIATQFTNASVETRGGGATLGLIENVMAMFPEDTPARRRVMMELCRVTDGVSMSIAAESMITGMDKAEYSIGKQPKLITDLAEHEAKRRGLYFDRNTYKELYKLGLVKSKSSDILDLTKVFQGV